MKRKVGYKDDNIRDSLGRFLPGRTGNLYAAGRPLGSLSLVTLLKRYLGEHPDEAQKLIEALVKQGKYGNMFATKEILERIDGKVPETHQVDVLPIRLVFIPAEKLIKEDEELKQITDGK